MSVSPEIYFPVLDTKMTLVIGIDEVGYGPKLGPLIITGIVFDIPNYDNNDIWGLLGISKNNKKSHSDTQPLARSDIVVCDSKKLFHGNLARLEKNALPFIEKFLGFNTEYTYKQVLSALNIADSLNLYSWYERDLSLPLIVRAYDIKKQVQKLNDAFTGANIKLKDIKINIVEPIAFNKGICAFGNKSKLLFYETWKIIEHFISKYPEEKIVIWCGKQGGRNYYLDDIRCVLPQVPNLASKVGCKIFSLREGKDISEYKIVGKVGYNKTDYNFSIAFIVDGEDKCFLISLASIIGKYIRELSMKLFNIYWQNKIQDLKPTSGYGTKTNFFLQKIKPFLNNNGLSHFVRVR